MQGQTEDPVTFLNRMRSDAVVISDSMTESQCVSTFIANLLDTAYATRLQEYQQRGECETWKQARDLIDEMSRKNFAAANAPLRYWTMEQEPEEVRAFNQSSNANQSNQNCSPYVAEMIEQLLQQRPVLLELKDSLHKRCLKCLKMKNHNPKYCKLAGKKNRCHICGHTSHEGDTCSRRTTPKDQWYCNVPYEETVRQETNPKPPAAPVTKDKSQTKEEARIWGQIGALRDLVSDQFKNPHVVARLKQYHDEGKMTSDQAEKYLKAVNDYENF
jgi:hypothetical protein